MNLRVLLGLKLEEVPVSFGAISLAGLPITVSSSVTSSSQSHSRWPFTMKHGGCNAGERMGNIVSSYSHAERKGYRREEKIYPELRSQPPHSMSRLAVVAVVIGFDSDYSLLLLG